MRDTLVIGAGLAGLMGTLALAEAGLRPLLLAKGNGATHWAGGTIDLWGAGDDPLAGIVAKIAQQPHHPYARVGESGIRAAADRLLALTRAARYPYVGTVSRNVLLPSALGAVRPAALFPATMAAGDMRAGGELLIAGFHELRDFFPPLAAANLRAQGIDARGVYLDVPTAFRRRDYSTRTFAELFDRPAFRAAIGAQLRTQRGTATRIGMPAVLGLYDPLAVVADLQTAAGALVFEIPTLPPSVPGIRLVRIFERAIVAAGGRVQIGSEVVRAEHDTTRITAAYTEAAAREQRHAGARWLLATGGVVGGGINSDHTGAFWETAFNLPLAGPDTRDGWFAARALASSGHPIFTAGVATNDALVPLDGLGRVAYTNVRVAGGALAGADTIREGSRTGVSLATGWAAGLRLAALED